MPPADTSPWAVNAWQAAREVWVLLLADDLGMSLYLQNIEYEVKTTQVSRKLTSTKYTHTAEPSQTKNCVN